jgi:hypothetical protein
MENKNITEILNNFTTPEICDMIKEGGSNTVFEEDAPIRQLVVQIFGTYDPIKLIGTINLLALVLVRRIQTYGWLDGHEFEEE